MLWVYTLAMPSTSFVALGLSLLQFRHLPIPHPCVSPGSQVLMGRMTAMLGHRSRACRCQHVLGAAGCPRCRS